MAQYLFLALYFLTAVSIGQFHQFSIDSLCANTFMLIVRLDSIHRAVVIIRGALKDSRGDANFRTFCHYYYSIDIQIVLLARCGDAIEKRLRTGVEQTT
jgi:hypothetical protein